MRIVLILFPAVLLIAIADAQKKANITKPVVNLEKRPRRPLWNRPPEERRKLSLFPRNNMKFVVTPKTVVTNDDAAKEGLPTRRPLLRRFTMQDRNEKGTWAFAPRQPLMKTNKFTVTLAPPKSSERKAIDEMESEESITVNTVINKAKLEEPSSHNQKLNKGNLIEMLQIKKTENLKKADKKVVGEEFSQGAKANDHIKDMIEVDIVQINDNSTSELSKVTKVSPIDIRRLNDEDVIIDVINTRNENRNKYLASNLNRTAATFKNEASKYLLENKAVDLNELKYAIEQNESNSLTTGNEESDVLNVNDLEIPIENIVNNTDSSAAGFNKNIPKISQYNEPNVTLEAMPKVNVSKPNEFYEVIISRSTDIDKDANLDGDFFDGPIPHGSVIMGNDEKHIVSDNALNGQAHFTENVSDSLIGGNLKSSITFMEKQTDGIQTQELFNKQRDIVENSRKETKTQQSEQSSTTYSTNDDIESIISNDAKYEIQTDFPIKSNDTDSKELLLEMYESNISLSSEELPSELVDEIPNEFVIENINIVTADNSYETHDSMSVEQISNESISDQFNNYTEEHSNEPLTGKSTSEEIFNESSSNMAGEELSNESGYLTDEISNEYAIEEPNNFTGEEFINESSSNMAGEEISNESYLDQSNISNEYVIEEPNNFTGEDISNESSSNMAGEETSNESYPDQSNVLTKEPSNEYTFETSNNYTGGEISNESSSMGEAILIESDKPNNLIEGIRSGFTKETIYNFTNDKLAHNSSIDNPDIVIDERISGQSVRGSQEPEVAEEALTNRFKRSNNIIEEEILPTTVSGFKYAGSEITLKHDSSYRNVNA